MKSLAAYIATAVLFVSVGVSAAHAASSRYEGAQERYIDRVVDRYVALYGDALDGDAKARKRVDLMARVYPYQIVDKAKSAAAEKWGVMLTEN